MPPAGPIDSQTLERLRSLIWRLHRERPASVPMDDFVQLADQVRLDAGLTVDFEASRALGAPVVVLRLPPDETPPASDDALQCLSRREREVAEFVAEGLSNKQIAARMFLSIATIKDHVHRILEKTGLPNRAAVAAARHRTVMGPPAPELPEPGTHARQHF